MKETERKKNSEFDGKDADRLIASYGRTANPEKKAALLEKLRNERAVFEKEQVQSPRSRSSDGKDR